MALEKLDNEKSLGEADRYYLEKPVEALQNSSRLIHNVKKTAERKGRRASAKADGP